MQNKYSNHKVSFQVIDTHNSVLISFATGTFSYSYVFLLSNSLGLTLGRCLCSLLRQLREAHYSSSAKKRGEAVVLKLSQGANNLAKEALQYNGHSFHCRLSSSDYITTISPMFRATV